MVDAMLMMLLTLPGTPTNYYGDEIGMEDTFYRFDETKDPSGLHYNAVRSKCRLSYILEATNQYLFLSPKCKSGNLGFWSFGVYPTQCISVTQKF